MKINTTLEKFTEGLSVIEQQGGRVSRKLLDHTIEGNASISGVLANFEFDHGALTIEIVRKPFLATTEMIEEKIREFFKS